MSKNAVDIANALLAEKAALEARVKELEQQKSQWVEWAKEGCATADKMKAELDRLKAQAPVAYRWEGKISGNICYDGIKPLGVISQPLYAQPLPAVPQGWEACSPEWIERNGSCSCAEAPRIAFGNTGPHYHPAVFARCQQQRLVVKLPVIRIYDTCREPWEVKAYQADEIIEAIKAAGGEIAE